MSSFVKYIYLTSFTVTTFTCIYFLFVFGDFLWKVETFEGGSRYNNYYKFYYYYYYYFYLYSAFPTPKVNLQVRLKEERQIDFNTRRHNIP